MTLITDYASQMEAKFITGAEPLSEESFKAYQDQLITLGADTYQKILYDYYEAYKAN